MIKIKDNYFELQTKDTTYVFSYTNSGLLVHNYYGKKVDFINYDNIIQKLDGGAGTAILYENNNQEFIDNMDLEVSFIGKGDYRESLLRTFNQKLGYTANFKYKGYEILDKVTIYPTPSSYNPTNILRIDLKYNELELSLYYKIFEEENIISKYVVLTNNTSDVINIERIMSNQLDIPNSNLEMITFDGSWANERHMNSKDITSGIYINDSKLGVSSNRHNPFFILKDKQASYDYGSCYGFNLIYSGNHKEIVEVNQTSKVRVLQGLNDHAFCYFLKPNESFVTPEAIMSYTNNGLNSLTNNMHNFINNHIVRGLWSKKMRPVLINNWEATYFKFNEKKLLEIAKKAKSVGIELFVLDDGWFGKRNNDTCSLGDYNVNYDKLPSGLKGLAEKINNIGLDFGLWVEPEMINEDSTLYKAHPEYAVKLDNDKPSLGRNQMLLDYTSEKVRNYVIDNLTATFSSCNLKYVKWDFNRPITELYSKTLDNQGEFFYRYIKGLYEVLEVIMTRFPNILFEGCASGGNRFDLGILCYFPQIWTSDNTDYLERIYIQKGTSMGYPLSVISNHVSTIPNHQMLRNTPLESRFNLACFGVLGYELDLTDLSKDEEDQIKKQIAFYKLHRNTFQYGRLYHYDKYLPKNNHMILSISSNEESILGYFQELVHPSLPEDIVTVKGIEDDETYFFTNLPNKNNIKTFGGLINMVLPFRIKLNGKLHNLISKIFKPDYEKEQYIIKGNALKYCGVRLHQQFMGTGFNSNVRVLKDFGSRIYIISKYKDVKKYKKIKK